MVLCQIYITNPTNQLIPIGVNGRKKVKIVRIDFSYTANNDKVVQLQSSILRVPYGNVAYITMSNNPNHQISNISNDMIFDTNINGNLDLNIIDVATGLAPAGFVSFMLLLDITPSTEDI